MKRVLTLAASLAFMSFPAMAEEMVKSRDALGIQADGLYSFETATVQKNGVVGGEIENITGAQIKIVRAESDVAERVELHTHLHEDGVMKMREVESYTVESGGEFELGPKAEHIMLIGLKSPLKQGDVFSVRLFDEDGASIEVPVLVHAAGDIPADEADDAETDHSEHEGHGDHSDDHKNHNDHNGDEH